MGFFSNIFSGGVDGGSVGLGSRPIIGNIPLESVTIEKQKKKRYMGDGKENASRSSKKSNKSDKKKKKGWIRNNKKKNNDSGKSDKPKAALKLSLFLQQTDANDDDDSLNHTVDTGSLTASITANSLASRAKSPQVETRKRVVTPVNSRPITPAQRSAGVESPPLHESFPLDGVFESIDSDSDEEIEQLLAPFQNPLPDKSLSVAEASETSDSTVNAVDLSPKRATSPLHESLDIASDDKATALSLPLDEEALSDLEAGDTSDSTVDLSPQQGTPPLHESLHIASDKKATALSLPSLVQEALSDVEAGETSDSTVDTADLSPQQLTPTLPLHESLDINEASDEKVAALSLPSLVKEALSDVEAGETSDSNVDTLDLSAQQVTPPLHQSLDVKKSPDEKDAALSLPLSYQEGLSEEHNDTTASLESSDVSSESAGEILVKALERSPMPKVRPTATDEKSAAESISLGDSQDAIVYDDSSTYADLGLLEFHESSTDLDNELLVSDEMLFDLNDMEQDYFSAVNSEHAIENSSFGDDSANVDLKWHPDQSIHEILSLPIRMEFDLSFLNPTTQKVEKQLEVKTKNLEVEDVEVEANVEAKALEVVSKSPQEIANEEVIDNSQKNNAENDGWIANGLLSSIQEDSSLTLSVNSSMSFSSGDFMEEDFEETDNATSQMNNSLNITTILEEDEDDDSHDPIHTAIERGQLKSIEPETDEKEEKELDEFLSATLDASSKELIIEAKLEDIPEETTSALFDLSSLPSSKELETKEKEIGEELKIEEKDEEIPEEPTSTIIDLSLLPSSKESEIKDKEIGELNSVRLGSSMSSFGHLNELDDSTLPMTDTTPSSFDDSAIRTELSAHCPPPSEPYASLSPTKQCPSPKSALLSKSLAKPQLKKSVSWKDQTAEVHTYLPRNAQDLQKARDLVATYERIMSALNTRKAAETKQDDNSSSSSDADADISLASSTASLESLLSALSQASSSSLESVKIAIEEIKHETEKIVANNQIQQEEKEEEMEQTAHDEMIENKWPDIVETSTSSIESLLSMLSHASSNSTESVKQVVEKLKQAAERRVIFSSQQMEEEKNELMKNKWPDSNDTSVSSSTFSSLASTVSSTGTSDSVKELMLRLKDERARQAHFSSTRDLGSLLHNDDQKEEARGNMLENDWVDSIDCGSSSSMSSLLSASPNSSASTNGTSDSSESVKYMMRTLNKEKERHKQRRRRIRGVKDFVESVCCIPTTAQIVTEKRMMQNFLGP